MKKLMITLVGASLLLSSCGSNEAAGAYTGSAFGNMLGSAIGGIAGGWKGHDVGALIGTVGGAAVGAAVGAAADRKQQEAYNDYATTRQQQTHQRMPVTTQQGSYGSGRTMLAASEPALEIRHAEIYEDRRDGVLTRGEQCQVIFEIVNHGDQTVYDVFPLVEETTRNKHIHISPNLRIESIAPHQAIRYTATLQADKGLKKGIVIVSVGVAQGNTVVKSQTRQFTINTAK